ncbi:hypothetical protein J3R30DRAFT_3684380 [Lentinula aciculospora]|uniref:Uncharacterized protein n=1 Tax=Lentinula aciculospora TaxID=153920 RepID=A0A9W9A5P4_9AGAR|nr:hypothetical protein J3R30DRAFT_3684380 [Lentinula aciculospora]
MDHYISPNLNVPHYILVSPKSGTLGFRGSSAVFVHTTIFISSGKLISKFIRSMIDVYSSDNSTATMDEGQKPKHSSLVVYRLKLARAFSKPIHGTSLAAPMTGNNIPNFTNTGFPPEHQHFNPRHQTQEHICTRGLGSGQEGQQTHIEEHYLPHDCYPQWTDKMQGQLVETQSIGEMEIAVRKKEQKKELIKGRRQGSQRRTHHHGNQLRTS